MKALIEIDIKMLNAILHLLVPGQNGPTVTMYQAFNVYMDIRDGEMGKRKFLGWLRSVGVKMEGK